MKPSPPRTTTRSASSGETVSYRATRRSPASMAAGVSLATIANEEMVAASRCLHIRHRLYHGPIPAARQGNGFETLLAHRTATSRPYEGDIVVGEVRMRVETLVSVFVNLAAFAIFGGGAVLAMRVLFP